MNNEGQTNRQFMQLFKLESELDMKNDELTELYTEAFKFHQANKNIKKNKKDVIGDRKSVV